MTKIPKEQLDKLVTLRDQILNKKDQVHELEYKAEQLRSDIKYQLKRLNILSFETIISMGLSPDDYAINVDSTKLEKRPKHK